MMREKNEILNSDLPKYLNSEAVEHAKLEVLIDIRDELRRLNDSLKTVVGEGGGRARLQVCVD